MVDAPTRVPTIIEAMTKKQVTVIFLAALMAIVLYSCYLIVKPFLKPILFAAVIAIAAHPVHVRIHRRVHNRSAAALLSTTAFIFVVVIPAFALGWTITGELKDLYRELSQKSAADGGLSPYLMQLIPRLLEWIAPYVHVSESDLAAALRGRLEQTTTFALRLAAGVFGNVTSLVASAVLTLFIVFFLFRDGRSTLCRATAMLPLRAGQVGRLFRSINDTVVATVYGVLAVAAVQGALTGVAFWALGVPSPVLWGLVAAMFCLVPVVGTAAVWVPVSLILILSGHWGRGLILFAWGTGVVHPVDNIGRPYVISGRVGLHPLYVFFALLGGLQAYGIIGLFVGPVVFSITMALFGILREETRVWQRNWRETSRSSPSFTAPPEPIGFPGNP